MSTTTHQKLAAQIENIRAMRAALRAEMQTITKAATQDIRRTAFHNSQTQTQTQTAR